MVALPVLFPGFSKEKSLSFSLWNLDTELWPMDSGTYSLPCDCVVIRERNCPLLATAWVAAPLAGVLRASAPRPSSTSLINRDIAIAIGGTICRDIWSKELPQ